MFFVLNSISVLSLVCGMIVFSCWVDWTGGSLFLFNKRVLRFFRRDGHNWRKKKDGRTVGEAHERLKVC